MKTSRIKDITGKKFNRLKVLSFAYLKKQRAYWKFKCDCGTVKIIGSKTVIANKTRSCGCLKKEAITKTGKAINFIHGMSHTSIHAIWATMIQRCYDKNCSNYSRYGERGIKICDRWRYSFINFYKDMGNKPKGKTLGRINNNGNYEKSNCRWENLEEQNNNKRNNVFLLHKGIRYTGSQLSRKLGKCRSFIARRMITKKLPPDTILIGVIK
jgi:hypothetical protein